MFIFGPTRKFLVFLFFIIFTQVQTEESNADAEGCGCGTGLTRDGVAIEGESTCVEENTENK